MAGEKCSRCGHKAHQERCTTLGKVECRRGGGAIVRGRWPCGCEHVEEERKPQMAAECRRDGCQEEIDWATTPKDKQMPVNHSSAGVEGGDLAVWRDGQHGDLRCRVLKKGEQIGPGEILGTNHWRTCKNPPNRSPRSTT